MAKMKRTVATFPRRIRADPPAENLGGGNHPYGINGCSNVVITSPFGMRTMGGITEMHWGIDVAWLGGGNPNLFPIWDGQVTFTGWGGGWGNMVQIKHENVEDLSGRIHPTIYTLYAHLHSISTSVGQNVTLTDPIGREGTTGNSTGDHLHLEIVTNPSFFNGQGGATIGRDIFDPEQWIDFICGQRSAYKYHDHKFIAETIEKCKCTCGISDDKFIRR